MGRHADDVLFLFNRLTSEHETWRAEAKARLIAARPIAELEARWSTADVSTSVALIDVFAGLGQFEVLLSALSDSRDHGAVAIAAERALVRVGSPAVTGLRDALSAEGPLRVRALKCLSRIPGALDDGSLEAATRDSLGGVRFAAVEAMLQRRDRSALEALRGLLRDPEENVREAAADLWRAHEGEEPPGP